MLKTAGSEQPLVRNVFSWEHLAIYLSGPIDFDRGGGKSWREEWTVLLKDIGFREKNIFNPCKKPLPSNTPFNLDDEAKIMQDYRSKKQWESLCEVMSQIAHIDLRLVDKSDIVLVNMPKIGLKPFSDLLKEVKLIGDDSFSALAEKIVSISSDIRVPTYGTIHEIVVARQQRKPVYIVWDGAKETCSAWLMWLVGHNNVFGTVEELMSRLDGIAKGKASYNAKDWLLLDLGSSRVV